MAKSLPVFRPLIGSLIAAAMVVGLFVLPAEYGIDPTGIGRLLGLTSLAEKPPEALRAAETDVRHDEISFELQPFESVEYKYRLEEGAGMVFDWQAGGDVVYELHAEPDGAEEGFAVTFSKDKGLRERGTYTAEFGGIHGWYWENRSGRPVTVHLKADGFFETAKIFRDGFVQDRAISE